MFTDMQTLRTPDDRFDDLPDFPYAPSYSEISDDEGGTLRVAWVQDGPGRRRPGSHAARRAVVVVSVPQDDSDTGRRRASRHLPGPGRVRSLGQADPHRGPQLCAPCRMDAGPGFRRPRPSQRDPGRPGLGRADRVAAGRRASRTVLHGWSSPTPGCPTESSRWPRSGGGSARPSRRRRRLNVGWFVQGGCRQQMSDEVRAGYDAPFPDDEYCAGPRAMPGLVPTSPDDPAAAANKAAWAKLSVSPTPMLVAFSDSDPITGPMARDLPARDAWRAGHRSPGDRTAPDTSCKRTPAKNWPATSWSSCAAEPGRFGGAGRM